MLNHEATFLVGVSGWWGGKVVGCGVAGWLKKVGIKLKLMLKISLAKLTVSVKILRHV